MLTILKINCLSIFSFIQSLKIKRSTLIIFLFFLLPIKTYSQDSLINLANKYYQNGKFFQAGEIFDSYFKKNEGTGEHFYNAACSWSLANEKEKALQYLQSAFIYGFSNIKHVESDSDLANIKSSKRFKDLIKKEKQFYNKSHIDFKDIIQALQKRKVVFLHNKNFSNSYGNWLDTPYDVKKVLQSFPKGGLTLTKDSLIDFSDRSLYINNGKGKIHLANLKLKKLEVNASHDVSGGNKAIPFENWNVVNLYKITANEFNWVLNGYNNVRFNEINTANIRRYQSINLPKFSIYKSNLTLSKIFFEEGMSTAMYYFGSFDNPLEDLSISYSTIRSTEDYPSLIPLMIFVNNFYFSSNTIDSELSFGSSKVNSLYMNKNVFKKAVDISKTNFYNSNNYVPIEQFKDGFGIDDDFIRPWEEKKKKLLITGTEEEVKDKESFDNLSYTYKLMHTNYRERGDLNSANTAYVKLKEITLSRDYYLYTQNGGFELWVQYRVGKLIKFYTNSSTSPARAIVISFLIILAFSLFYMFYPSEWDVKSKPKLITDYKMLVQKNKHGYVKPFVILFVGFFKSWLNAFTLSLNAFVTLGFGAIPTTGVARYLTIIQGFLGWFLLSLFTVALINQALV